jgi:competence protein ComEA
MNASEKRILKLAIILFTIGLVFRYLPWGLPSIESFEVGDAIVVANSSPPALEIASLPVVARVDTRADSVAGFAMTLDKVSDSAGVATTEKFPKKTKKTVSFPLHVNTASAEDLCALKGVGPKLAEKIIVHRNTFGPFKGASDLKKVHGIGKKKLEMMLQFIIFD